MTTGNNPAVIAARSHGWNLNVQSPLPVRVFRMVSAALLAVGLIVGLSACSLIGDRLMTPDPPVREMQRDAALYFRSEYQPNVETVRFTRDGSRPGVGVPWCVNAVATVDGVDYQVIIGPATGPGFVGDNGMPPPAPTPSGHLPLTVVYSDGTSEVIE
ncbi:hypothetical protein ACIRCZ_04440 [Leifsonia sp. NPDC102414]|uniref:hypothetical protein n=1 Tax=Leifsonia sp. NPDC102414 TaxID=3364124 RepID=UPI0037FB895E